VARQRAKAEAGTELPPADFVYDPDTKGVFVYVAVGGAHTSARPWSVNL